LIRHPVDIITQKSHHLVLSPFAAEDSRFFHKKETSVGAIINDYLTERLAEFQLMNREAQLNNIGIYSYVNNF
jgi:hypothetical protein